MNQVRTEDTKPKRRNEKKSKPDPRPVHTKKRRKKTENSFPNSYKANIYCTSHLQSHFKLPTIVKYSLTSRITSSHAKQSKMLVSPSFSVDPSFPTESKAGQLVSSLVYPLDLVTALPQVSKLFPANRGLNDPEIPF